MDWLSPGYETPSIVGLFHWMEKPGEGVHPENRG